SKPGFCAPAFLFWALAAGVIFASTRWWWYTNRAVYILACAQVAMLAVSLLVAGLLAFWPRARTAVLEHLDDSARHGSRYHRLCLGAAYLGIFAYLLFVKHCQYRGLQLSMDTTATANV